MTYERSNVRSPLWRKKVDGSLFEYKVTTLPNWMCDQWKIPARYRDVTSKKDPRSFVKIKYQGKTYHGWLTSASKKRVSPAYRLWFEEDFLFVLKNTFSMTYMRYLEGKLRSIGTDKIETEIPFWEFLDFEFLFGERQFILTPHYTQLPTFPNLFTALQGQPAVRRLEDELNKGEKPRIHKVGWIPRQNLDEHLTAVNVIYHLYDSKNKFYYIGEAKNLVRRLKQEYSVIPKWDFFRYDALPMELEPYRVTLERMFIYSMAMILKNQKHAEIKLISDDHVLRNRDIDSR
jgi:hypothetical protein